MVRVSRPPHDPVRLARRQNGAIHGSQLRAAGMTHGAIRGRVRRGRLIRAFFDVFIVGDPELMPLALPSAALLSIGPDAVLSHRSAAAIHGLAEPDPDVIDVTVAGRHPHRRPGIRLHRVRALHPADTTTRSNLAVTSIPRTAIDFAAQATSSELQRAFGEARAKHRLTDRALHTVLTRLPANHPGAAIVRAMLNSNETYDRSEAERVMRELCAQAQLPQPLVNARLHGFLVDFLWPEATLVVEVDGYGTHGTRHAFENDRRRDQIHAAAGYVVVRVTWQQLQNDPMPLIARLAAALARRAA